MTAADALDRATRTQESIRRHGRSLLLGGVLLVFLVYASGALVSGPGSRDVADVVTGAGFALLVLIGVVLAVALPRLRPIHASLLALLAMLPVVWLAWANPRSGALLPMEYSLLTVLVMFACNVVAAWFIETQRRQRLLEAFGHYAPPEVVARINRTDGDLKLEAEARELSIMFCDIRDFSSISETLEPKKLAVILNSVFTPLTDVIYRHRGVVDKYLGDGVMAFWGAPLDDPQHAGNALAAAFEIQEMLARLRRSFEARGWPLIHMGIGINTGVVSVGNMGSRKRIAYTAVGDAVNLAARLQDLTRVFATRIIVGERTKGAFPSPVYRELGLVKVRGKEQPVRIYEPCNPSTDPESTIVANMQRHNQALRHYYERRWNHAEALFRALRKLNPGDPVYRYYLARIADFRRSPPSENWRGEVRFTPR